MYILPIFEMMEKLNHLQINKISGNFYQSTFSKKMLKTVFQGKMKGY